MATLSALASTWSSRRKPFATWFYEARPPEPEPGGTHILEDPVQRARWLSATVASLLRAIDAKLEQAAVVTQAQGEDAFVARANETGVSERLISYLRRCLDFVALDADLSLVIMTPEGGTLPLPYCLTLAVEAVTDERHYGPIMSRAHPLEFSVTVTTNLFAEATGDGSGDNRAWARANRPLLEQILRAPLTIPGMSLKSWDADRSSDQMRANGFADLAEEYRVYHLGHSGKDLHYIERKTDGVEVIEIRQFEVCNNQLQVRYRELQAKANPAVAAILILEHFIPEAASRADVPIETIQLEDIDTKRIRCLPWSSARK